MTNSLLERLNHWRMECVGIQDADALMKEAADEIARLQRDLADCTESHQRTNAKVAELEDDAELLSELHGLFTLCANTTGHEFKAARTKLYQTLSEIPERLADSPAAEPDANPLDVMVREPGDGAVRFPVS